MMDKPATYRIRVRGNLPETWISKLNGLQVSAASSLETTLEGWLPDQAALSGVLAALYTLHLPIIEVTELPED